MRATTIALLMLLYEMSAAQDGQIKGRVVGKPEGEPLAGVNVFVQGTLRGTTTDIKGEFLLSRIPPGTYKVTFSILGYQRKDHSDITVSDQVSVELNVELDPAPLQTEPVVVTASKREQSLEEIPTSVSVMESKVIEDHNFTTVENALHYVPGVNLTESQVSIRGSSGYSRGAGSRVLMLVDGIPLLTGDTGELNFETIPIGQVDRIEVVKGAGSALYGSNALGGVINVLTKPIPEVPETKARVYGGWYAGPSYDIWDWGGGSRFMEGVAVSHGQRFGDTGVLLYGSAFGDDGYRQNDSRHRYNGYLKLRQEFSPFDVLTATANLLHQTRGSFLNWKDLDHALVPPDIQQGDRVTSTRGFISSQYQHVASSDFALTIRGMWYRNHFDDTVDTLTHSSRSDVLRGEGQATWFVNRSNILTFGVEGNYEGVDADLFGNHSGVGVAAYAQDEISLNEEMKLTLGGRFDLEDIDSLETDSQFSPKLAFLFTPSAGTTLRASVGRGFRSPSVAEAFVTSHLSILTLIPNPDLKAERSISYELGGKQLLGENVLIDLALFQSDFWNLIEPQFVSGTTAQFVNVTRARIRGVETNLGFGLFSRTLFLNAGYTYVYPRDLSENDILKYRPRHLLYIAGDIRPGQVFFGGDFKYLSRVEKIDEEFKAFVPDVDARVAIYVVDLRVGVDFLFDGASLSTVLNINNIFQYNYVELVGNLAPPRSVVLTLEGTI